MLKKIIVLVSALFFTLNISADCNLSIYDYLNHVKLQSVDNNRLNYTCQKSLQLLASINRQLRSGVLDSFPMIGYRFLKICQFLDEFNEIKVRDLNRLREESLSFDNYLNRYDNNAFSDEQVSLVREIQEFNYLLYSCLLDKEFVDSSFASKHKLLVGSTVCCIITLIGSYFLYDYCKKNNEGKVFDKDFWHRKWTSFWENRKRRNLRSKYSVKQLRATRQKGLECGLHAIKNCLVFSLYNDEGQIEKCLADGDWADEVLAKNRELLIRNRNISLQNAISAKEDSIRRLKSESIPDKGLIRKREIEKRKLGREKINTGSLATGEIEKLLNDEGFSGIPVFDGRFFRLDNQKESKKLFHEGKSQSFVVRSGYHWFAAKLIPSKDSDKDSKPRVLVANSLSADLTNDRSLNRIIDWYYN